MIDTPPGWTKHRRGLFGGIQVTHRFANGYGASIANQRYLGTDRVSGLWNLAVIRFAPDSDEWDIDTSTPITDDTIAWLDAEDVLEHLARIEALPPRRSE